MNFLHYIKVLNSPISGLAVSYLFQFGFKPGIEIDNWDFWLKSLSYISVFVEIIAAVCDIKYSKKISRLKRELNTYKSIVVKTSSSAKEKIRNKLLSTVRNLGFYEQDIKQDRITIYALEKDKGFYIIDRFSLNPQYENKHKDKVYPINKGCIAKGYQDGFYYESGTKVCDPNKNLKKYKDYMNKKYKYKPIEIKDIAMKSRFFAVCRVDCKIEQNNENLGVIVYESLLPNRYSEADIRKELSVLSNKISYFLYLRCIEKKKEILLNDINKKIGDKLKKRKNNE